MLLTGLPWDKRLTTFLDVLIDNYTPNFSLARVYTLIKLWLIGPTRSITPGYGFTRTSLSLWISLKIIFFYSFVRVINRRQGSLLTTSPTFYFKLLYIDYFSIITPIKMHHYIKRYCNDLDIKLVFFFF